MLPCFVISRRHPPRLPRHCRGASRGPSSLLSLSGSPRITLVGILLSHNPLRCNTYAPPRKCCKQTTYGPPKPFRCNTYKKQGEGVPIMVNQVLETSHPLSSATLRLCAPPSILRTHFQVPYPATPLFATLTKTPGAWGYSSHSGTPPLVLSSRRLPPAP